MSEDVSNTRVALRAFWQGFLRLLLILFLGALVVSLVFWGGPYVYRLFTQPVVEMNARVGGVEASLDQSRAEAASLEERLEELEAEAATSAADRLQAATQAVGLEIRTSRLETAISDQAAALARLDELDAALADLESRLEQQSAASEEQQARLDALLTDPASPLAVTRREVQVLKAMQLLNRARLFLLQSNFGLARADVASAREILDDARGSAAREARPRLAAWVARLDLVLAALPDFPVQAADDLETAWRMISADVAVIPPTVTPTPTYVTTATSTATPLETVTPTADLTEMPTATATPDE